MLTRLLPKQIDNAYQGRSLALWLLGLLAFIKLAMGANALLNTGALIVSADRIPLETFTPESQQVVIFMFQVWGLGSCLLAALAILALLRYRAMTPLMFLLLLSENTGRKLLSWATPLSFDAAAQAPSPGFAVNAVLIALLAFGLVLSLTPAKPRKNQTAAAKAM